MANTTYLAGDVLDIVRTLPAGSVDLVATSPPFLALRDYNGVDGQWGSEANPAAFLDHLLELVAELRRVLAPHGSLAIELGDTYSGSGGGGGDYRPGGLREGQVGFAGSEAARRRGAEHWRQKAVDRAAWPLAKSLCGTPTLFAWSLAYGRNLLNPAHELEPWRVRNLIAWARNNPPVGALGDKVRPAVSYITVATPSAKRWFDLDAVRHAHRPQGNGRFHLDGSPVIAQETGSRRDDGKGFYNDGNPAGAPPLDHWHDEPDGDLLWLINTHGSGIAHYAMWPPRLAERLVLMMCPAQVCRECGEPRRRIVERDGPAVEANALKRAPSGVDGRATGATEYNRAHFDSPAVTTIGWSDCNHSDYRPGVVLDCFAGTGTTLAVAEIHGRDAIGIDLDPANEQLLSARRDQVRKALLGVEPEMPGQLALLDIAQQSSER